MTPSMCRELTKRRNASGGSKKTTPMGLILMNFDYEIEYRSPKEFGNADGLSRLPCVETEHDDDNGQEVNLNQVQAIESLPVTVEMIAKETEKKPLLKLVKKFVKEGWPNKVDKEFRPFYIARNSLEIQSGCLMLGIRNEKFYCIHGNNPNDLGSAYTSIFVVLFGDLCSL
ncbi:hypothetical protein niasHS_015487 [Heterodera schachtii]|uniref:Uncharacterized protein n=1 Tax=Heterodera schachtii TaxID=97005 RepID=A0ABD2I7E2_HETSC